MKVIDKKNGPHNVITPKFTFSIRNEYFKTIAKTTETAKDRRDVRFRTHSQVLIIIIINETPRISSHCVNSSSDNYNQTEKELKWTK